MNIKRIITATALTLAMAATAGAQTEVTDTIADFTDVSTVTIVKSKDGTRMAEPIEEAERQSSSPAESMADMAEDIKELIESRLDERSKEILLLHDSLDYDYDEIAQRMGITESHARVILSRARKTIRNAYRELR